MLKKVTGPNNIYDSYEYDEYGREIAVTSYYIEEEKSFTTRKDYDENNRVVEITYPSGFAISYLYNNYGYLNEVKRKDNSSTIWKAGAMNEFGQWKDYTLGNNLLMSEFGYDANGMPETIKTKRISDNEIRQNLEYSFNPITGNLTNRKDHMHKLGENSFIEEFGYDNLNRLVWNKINGGTKHDIVYDNNKTGVIQNKALVGEYLYEEKQPHAISSLNSIQSGVLSDAVYTYTPFNKVDTISEDGKSYTITYGPDYTRRISICTINGSTKTTWYDGFYEMSEEGGISRQFHYITGGDGLAAIYVINNGQPGMYYIHKDYLGSYNVITDDNGNEFAENSFDPWGRRRNPDDWSYDNVTVNSLFARGFTGHEHLDAFGLINMNGRVYDPVLGMFLSPDNYVQAPDFTQNFNRYSYCLNNPLKYTDLSGDAIDWILMGIMVYMSSVEFGAKAEITNSGTFWDGAWKGMIVGAGSYFAGYGSGCLASGNSHLSNMIIQGSSTFLSSCATSIFTGEFDITSSLLSSGLSTLLVGLQYYDDRTNLYMELCEVPDNPEKYSTPDDHKDEIRKLIHQKFRLYEDRINEVFADGTPSPNSVYNKNNGLFKYTGPPVGKLKPGMGIKAESYPLPNNKWDIYISPYACDNSMSLTLYHELGHIRLFAAGLSDINQQECALYMRMYDVTGNVCYYNTYWYYGHSYKQIYYDTIEYLFK